MYLFICVYVYLDIDWYIFRPIIKRFQDLNLSAVSMNFCPVGLVSTSICPLWSSAFCHSCVYLSECFCLCSHGQHPMSSSQPTPLKNVTFSFILSVFASEGSEQSGSWWTHSGCFLSEYALRRRRKIVFQDPRTTITFAPH